MGGAHLDEHPPNSNPSDTLLKTDSRESPGGSVVRTLRFHCNGRRFHPWWGN